MPKSLPWGSAQASPAPGGWSLAPGADVPIPWVLLASSVKVVAFRGAHDTFELTEQDRSRNSRK